MVQQHLFIGVANDTGWLSFPDYTSVRVKVGLGLVRVWVRALNGGNSVIVTKAQTIIATGHLVTIAMAFVYWYIWLHELQWYCGSTDTLFSGGDPYCADKVFGPLLL